MGMKILVVGRGGREHSVIMHLEKSEKVKEIYAAPGNGGIENHAECVPIDEMDIEGLVHFAKEQQIDLTIVGPENPLNEGLLMLFKRKAYLFSHRRKKRPCWKAAKTSPNS